MACACVTKKGQEPQYPNAQGDRCKLFFCKSCKTWRPWCQGGADDARCDYCVTGIDPVTEQRDNARKVPGIGGAR